MQDAGEDDVGRVLVVGDRCLLAPRQPNEPRLAAGLASYAGQDSLGGDTGCSEVALENLGHVDFLLPATVLEGEEDAGFMVGDGPDHVDHFSAHLAILSTHDEVLG